MMKFKSKDEKSSKQSSDTEKVPVTKSADGKSSIPVFYNENTEDTLPVYKADKIHA